ncbi:hypothetical protein [Chitinophaga qingshengii]|uniref:ATP-binding protein n=1 Tax=Chitinophaga qingshengii TaxID=1569794 RepID=A0ABR7TNQ1_9BACT|nr:hypothetical protein [Chitinophaga qingshengii]MBC9930654.1 hypothetical protein [Chitinophaga qingshengii]
MKNLVGIPARHDNFYQRQREVDLVDRTLMSGNNIQIAAPRRVGKTSLLCYLLDNKISGRHYVYIDTESITEAHEFYKKMLEAIVRSPVISSAVKFAAGLKDKSDRFFNKIKSISILNNALEFNNNLTPRDYHAEFYHFLLAYAVTEETSLVLLIDEFPQTIQNIGSINPAAAVTFLQQNREIRLDPVVSLKVRFVYTGSIGLNQTVAALNATATINDLASLEVKPLTEEEALDLFHLLLSQENRTVDADGDIAFKEMVRWFIPFHIQLVVQEAALISSPGAVITRLEITQAIKGVLSQKHKNHFAHYYSRLKVHFRNGAFLYADEFLKLLASRKRLDKTAAATLATTCGITDFRQIIENLMYDGYIEFDDTSQNYLFNSPILMRWWEDHIC